MPCVSLSLIYTLWGCLAVLNFRYVRSVCILLLVFGACASAWRYLFSVPTPPPTPTPTHTHTHTHTYCLSVCMRFRIVDSNSWCTSTPIQYAVVFFDLYFFFVIIIREKLSCLFFTHNRNPCDDRTLMHTAPLTTYTTWMSLMRASERDRERNVEKHRRTHNRKEEKERKKKKHRHTIRQFHMWSPHWITPRYIIFYILSLRMGKWFISILSLSHFRNCLFVFVVGFCCFVSLLFHLLSDTFRLFVLIAVHCIGLVNDIELCDDARA